MNIQKLDQTEVRLVLGFTGLQIILAGVALWIVSNFFHLVLPQYANPVGITLAGWFFANAGFGNDYRTLEERLYASLYRFMPFAIAMCIIAYAYEGSGLNPRAPVLFAVATAILWLLIMALEQMSQRAREYLERIYLKQKQNWKVSVPGLGDPNNAKDG